MAVYSFLDLASSRVLYSARQKETLDWESVNKLCEQNSDFEEFLKAVKIDFESRRFHKNEYDSVVKDIRSYIREKLKIEQE